LPKRVRVEWIDSGAPVAFMVNQSQIQRHAEKNVGMRATAGDEGAGQTAAQGSVDEESREGKQRNQPEVEAGISSLVSFEVLSSEQVDLVDVGVWRVRKMAMMMASPTAASAAATTMTKKTKICPVIWCHMCAKATKVRLTALSISSIDMKMVMSCRLMRKLATPMGRARRRGPDKPEMGTVVGIVAIVPFARARRLEDGDEDEDAGDLEGRRRSRRGRC